MRRELAGEERDRPGPGLCGHCLLLVHGRAVQGVKEKEVRLLDSRGIQGDFWYSDDNWALAPSLTSLQDMITTVEFYAEDHNLKFSTDLVPRRCKTKTIAFIIKKTSP